MMRWLILTSLGCGSGGGFVGQQAEDTQAPKLGEGLVAITGAEVVLGETDDEAWSEFFGREGEYRTIIPAHAFVVDDFYIDRFPFPGVDGANWFTDGAHHSTIEALDAKLADFGRRACTIPELLYAAAGPDNLRYPYGDAHVSGRCDGDDTNPEPIGTFTLCESDFGVRDFMVRATWGRIDDQTREAIDGTGDHEQISEDLEYGVYGGTSRSDTIQAHSNFGFHTHAKEGEDRYLDDGFRICADSTPSTNQDAAFERWRANAVEAGSFAAMYGQ